LAAISKYCKNTIERNLMKNNVEVAFYLILSNGSESLPHSHFYPHILATQCRKLNSFTTDFPKSPKDVMQ